MPTLDQNYLAMREKVRTEGLYKRRYGYYALYSLFVVSGTLLSLYFITVSDNVFFQMANALLLSLALVQAGMLGHDASHGQIFKSKSMNRSSSAVILGLFGGLSELLAR